MAKYYGVLPSVIIENASTYDLMVYDVSMTWEEEMRNRMDNKSSVPNLSQEQLLQIMKESRGG